MLTLSKFLVFEFYLSENAAFHLWQLPARGKLEKQLPLEQMPCPATQYSKTKRL
jgi:hypothetical protein